MVKAAKEIQMENPREAETPSTGATSSPPEEQAKKPSMLCFKKRKKSCKKGLTVKDACEGASEKKSQCVSADQEEVKASSPSRSSKGTWAAIKNLARPRRRQKSSSRKKVTSDSQVQLEVDAEESCAQELPKKRASSGVKMPCVRFSRGKKKPSPSEAVEESEGSVQANEVMGVVNKASEEPEDLAPADKSESFSPVSAQEEQDTVKQEQHGMKEDQDTVKEDQDTGKEDQDTAKESDTSVGKSEPSTEPTCDAEEHSECTVQLEITDSETVDETAQDKLQEGSLPQTIDDAEGREVAPEASVSKDQPDNAPEITEWQESPNICKEMPERDELERSINLPKECKAEETVTDFSELASGGDAASVQEAASVMDAVSVMDAESVQSAESMQEGAVSVQDAANVQEAASVQEAVSVQDATSVHDEVNAQEAASMQEAVSVQETASVQEAVSVKDTASMQEVVSVQEAESVQDAVSVQETANVQDSASVQEAASIQDATSVQDLERVQEEVSVKDATSVQEAVSEQDATSVQDAESVQGAASVQEAVNVQEAASVQECSSRQVLEANTGTGVSIVITITEAEDSDNTDSDQAYEPSPVLHQKKRKGNKKSNRNDDVGQKEGPEAGGSPQADEKGLGDQGHRTGEQYELLLVETASSLVKAAIQSSIEQLVNEMALEQNKHNSFL